MKSKAALFPKKKKATVLPLSQPLLLETLSLSHRPSLPPLAQHRPSLPPLAQHHPSLPPSTH